MNIRILLVCLFIFLVGCSSLDKTPPPAITYSSEKEAVFTHNLWRAENIFSNSINEETQVTLLVGNDNSISGKSGCNQYNSQLTLEKNKIKVYRAAATLMACKPALMQLEMTYYDALEQSTIYDIDDSGKLNFYNNQGERVITFSKVPETYSSITGSVTYLERMALPPEATLIVSLLDVSKMDVSAKLIASKEYSFKDKQVPIEFDIKYLTDKIDQRHSYSVQAQIKLGDQLLFTSTNVHSVITKGSGQSVDIVLKKVPKKNAAKSTMVSYSCERDIYLTVSFTSQSSVKGDVNIAIVNSGKNNKPLILAKKPTASGFLYANNQYSLRGKGGEAIWTVGRMRALKCQADKTGKESEDIK